MSSPKASGWGVEGEVADAEIYIYIYNINVFLGYSVGC